MKLELLIEGLPPTVNHSYGQRQGKRGGKFKKSPLLEFEQKILQALQNTPWPFAPRQPLKCNLVFISPKVLTKKGELNLKWDTDNLIKHALDSAFRLYKPTANDAQIVSFGGIDKKPSVEKEVLVIELIGLDLVTWRETALAEGLALEKRLKELQR